LAEEFSSREDSVLRIGADQEEERKSFITRSPWSNLGRSGPAFADLHCQRIHPFARNHLRFNAPVVREIANNIHRGLISNLIICIGSRKIEKGLKKLIPIGGLAGLRGWICG
jgi:hypothetical protein